MAGHRRSLRNRPERPLLPECQSPKTSTNFSSTISTNPMSCNVPGDWNSAEERAVLLRRTGLVQEIIFLPQARAHSRLRLFRGRQLLHSGLSQRASSGRTRRRVHALQLRNHRQDSRRRQLPGCRSQQCPPPRWCPVGEYRLVELRRTYARCDAGGGAGDLHSGLLRAARQGFEQ